MRKRETYKAETVTIIALIIGGILYHTYPSDTLALFLGTIVGGYFGNLNPNQSQGSNYYDS